MHTPGEWIPKEDGNIWSEECQIIATVYDNVDSGLDRIGSEQSDFNLQLISSSPDLLEALTHLHDAVMLGSCRPDAEGNECPALLKARAAIQKATGEGAEG